MLVPQWANWEKFRELEELGLTMYGQMTAGSWIYIGTQGILQGRMKPSPLQRRNTLEGHSKGDSSFQRALEEWEELSLWPLP